MTQDELATVTQLHDAIAAHDAAAIALMRETQRHLRAARNIERKLERYEQPRKRAASQRAEFA